MASLAAHELEGALQDGARVPERPPAAAVGDGNVEQLGRRRLRHDWAWIKDPHGARRVKDGVLRRIATAGSWARAWA